LKRAWIISEADGQRVPLDGTLVIGRTPDCGFNLADTSASRRHVEVAEKISAENGVRYVWKDLGSTNGTLMNGSRMLAGELKHGDRLQIGDTVLRFDVEENACEASGKESGSSLFKETILGQSGEVERIEDTGRHGALLEAVYSVANEIASNYDLCSLTQRILETTMKAINAQRGAVFLRQEDGAPGPCPVCNKVHCIRDGELQSVDCGEIAISNTVARRVLRDGESVLYQDTRDESGASLSKSILSLELRSIICAPLRAKDAILGILYIDTDRQNQSYCREDMLLAAAVGNSAGLAIENARMHQAMLEKQRIEQEIETAWSIQQGFLVKDWPEDERQFAVYGETRPARTVGGDFYDFVQPDAGVAGILIGDVSGKGVPAALAMAQQLAEFRIHARDLESPCAVIRELNADLVERSRYGMFCTLCYIRLNLETGRIVCANAGHSPALRIGPIGVSQIAEASGPPAGILPDSPWEESEYTLAPGETVLLFTDGILEARNMVTHIGGADLEPDEYGMKNLIQVAESMEEVTPRALIETVQEDVRRYCAPAMPHDDCTLVAIRYNGP
jgi:phosphoserine phosphatase RsbU/P